MRSRKPRIADGMEALKVDRPEWVMRAVTGLQDVLYIVVAAIFLLRQSAARELSVRLRARRDGQLIEGEE